MSKIRLKDLNETARGEILSTTRFNNKLHYIHKLDFESNGTSYVIKNRLHTIIISVIFLVPINFILNFVKAFIEAFKENSGSLKSLFNSTKVFVADRDLMEN